MNLEPRGDPSSAERGVGAGRARTSSRSRVVIALALGLALGGAALTYGARDRLRDSVLPVLPHPVEVVLLLGASLLVGALTLLVVSLRHSLVGGRPDELRTRGAHPQDGDR